MGSRSRVVVASPDTAESERLAEWLSEGHEPIPTRLLAGAVEHVQLGQAQAVVADARFAFDDALFSMCRGRGATPLVVIGDPDPAAETTAERHGAFYVTRPLDRDMLLCAVAMALIDGRPARRSPRKPVGRLHALAEGHPCSLIDASTEGMRLEIPRGPRSAPPPFFTVRIPVVGLTLVVQRVWLGAPPQQAVAAVSWCGGELGENAASEVDKWRRFVDQVPARV